MNKSFQLLSVSISLFTTCCQLLTLNGSVELNPLKLDSVLVISVLVLMENVVTRECVFSPGQVKLGHQFKPEGHLMVSILDFVGWVQI